MKLLAFALVSLTACGADPVSYSAPVGINLTVKSSDVSNNAISDDKAITSESGNPFGAFVNDAHAKLGRDPSRIEIDSVNLILGAQSTGVTTLDQVYTGDVDVALITNDTNNTYDIGHVMNPTGVGPVAVSVNYDSTRVPALDYTKILTGSFKVVIRGPATATFSGKGAQANMQLTFTFAAFQ
ncbi:MAG: hypothetical protein JWO36_4496 [Myxococcales bacterium]|nr:hypothetical protein [Myxococcales bacterium]